MLGVVLHPLDWRETLPAMTDPFHALTSFQQAFKNGEIQLRQGEIDRELFVHADRAQGQPRSTYVRIHDQVVTALTVFALSVPVEGIRCYQLGVAVQNAFRGKGLAKNIVEASIVEMKNGLARNNVSEFYVE